MHTTAEIHAKEMLIRSLQTQASLMKKVAQVAEEIYGPNKKTNHNRREAQKIEQWAEQIQQEINP